MLDKPQFAATAENDTASGEIVHPSVVPTTGASVEKDQNHKEDTGDPRPIPSLDQESVAALLKFFELLDEWDRKET